MVFPLRIPSTQVNNMYKNDWKHHYFKWNSQDGIIFPFKEQLFFIFLFDVLKTKWVGSGFGHNEVHFEKMKFISWTFVSFARDTNFLFFAHWVATCYLGEWPYGAPMNSLNTRFNTCFMLYKELLGTNSWPAWWHQSGPPAASIQVNPG
jgi:hypothetical protein